MDIDKVDRRECWNSHPPRHPSPRTLIPLEHSSPWNTHPPGTPIPLEHSSPLELPSPGTPIPPSPKQIGRIP